MENKPICQHCGKEIERKTYSSGTIEENYSYLGRSFCDRSCGHEYLRVNQLRVSNYGNGRRLSRKTYAKNARAFKKSNCERCGTDKKLTVHHINKEWWNNDPSNLMTVCSSCHSKIHHEMGDIKVPIGDRLPCRICGAEYKPGSSRGDLCNTHRLQQQNKDKQKPCMSCSQVRGRMVGNLCIRCYGQKRYKELKNNATAHTNLGE